MKLFDSPWSKAWRGFEALIKTDPCLRSMGARVIGDEYQSTDGITTETPYILLIPNADPAGWSNERQHTGNLSITVEIGLPAKRNTELFDFWWMMVRAVYPQNQERRDARDRLLTEAGIPQITVVKNALNARRLEGNNGSLVADGIFSIEVEIDTWEIN